MTFGHVNRVKEDEAESEMRWRPGDPRSSRCSIFHFVLKDRVLGGEDGWMSNLARIRTARL